MPQTADYFYDELTTAGTKAPPIEGVVAVQDPLTLTLDDIKFVNTIDKLIDDSQKFFATKDLYLRRTKNLEYYLGKEIEVLEKKKELKEYNAKYLDNVIWESEATLKPIALSRIPDLIVKPGNETEESKATAKEVTDVINSDVRRRENRKVLGRAYRHRPIYFIGVIKYFWNPEKGRNGNYEFQAIHPDNIDVDHTALDNDTDKMDWIAHHYDLSIKQCFMKFPSRKAQLMRVLSISDADLENDAKLATKIKITEIWFTWYEAKGDEWQRIEGVAWKYGKVLLKKMKNPNWDWEGEDILFKYDESGKKELRVSEEDFRESLVSGKPIKGIQQKKIYHNHFEHPRKPFIFVGYDQLGKMPYDETSRIEQNLYLQDNVNKRGKQITELADGAKGKNVFSTESGLSKKDIEEIDMNNPNQDILVAGDLNAVWKFIPGTMPTAALFQDQNINRERIFSKMGAHSATRGEREAGEPATGTQILREADFGKSDDEVEETINYAAMEMSNAAMQMIKLRYTEEHLVKLLGKSGSVTFSKIKRDFIEDGMEVEVSASGTDKLMRKREAYDKARLEMIDPLTFFQDTDSPDPEGRTEKLITFKISLEQYFSKYVKGLQNAQQQGEAVNAAPVPGQTNGQPQNKVVMDLAMLTQGQIPTPPESVDALYVEAIIKFMRSPMFQELSPENQDKVKQYAAQVAQLAKGQAGTPAAGAESAQAIPPQEAAPVPATPI